MPTPSTVACAECGGQIYRDPVTNQSDALYVHVDPADFRSNPHQAQPAD
jgi:hypothetical protein